MRASPFFGGIEAEDEGVAAEARVGGSIGERIETVHIITAAGSEVLGVLGGLGYKGQCAHHGLVSVGFGVLGSWPKGSAFAGAAAGKNAESKEHRCET
jgi:hypothetical protein